MPFRYAIDTTRRLVQSVVAPPLTAEEVVQVCRELSADKRFASGFNQLHVVKPGALSTMLYEDLRSLRINDPFSPESLRAIVVNSELDFGVARMYEQLQGGRISVFRSKEDAERFLRWGY